MESSVLLSILLPIALGIIMFGLGLALSIVDFTRIASYPKAVALGLVCQMIILPGAGMGIARLFNLSPELSIGLILLAASPGGVTSNFYTHLAKGDLVLNITLTAFGSLLCIFTLPLIVNFSMQAIMDESKYLPLQFSKILQIFAVILVPVSIGMFIRKRNLSLATRLQKPVRIFSLVFLILLILSQVIKERENLGFYWQNAGLAVLCFNLLGMSVCFFVPRIFNISMKQSVAISMSSGIRNGTLAITIALSPSLLNNSVMSIPPAIYSLVMYFTAALFGYIISHKLKQKEVSYPPVVD